MPAQEEAHLRENLGAGKLAQLHAVVVPWPGQGHINPLLHLSKRLALQGFSITFVNLEFAHSRILSSIRRQEKEEEEQRASYTALSASPKLDIKFVSLPDGIPVGHARNRSGVELCKGVIRSSVAFEHLLEELQPPPSCIISDTFVLHTQDAANKLGIPRVAFWTQSVASYAVHLATARGWIETSFVSSEEKLITNIAGAPPLRPKDLSGFLQRQQQDPDSNFMYDFCTCPFLRTHEAVCVLMNTFDSLEGKAMEAVRRQQPDCTFYTIGPVLPVEYLTGMKLSQSSIIKTPGFWAEDYTCMEWLDKQAEGSVLYVSFGSLTELSNEELEEFARGLEASGMPVLWVLRPGQLKGGGHVALPQGFEERNKGHVVIVEWAPQLLVLAHPAVGAFLTHAGWNSTLEGIAQGKPLLGFPYFADQMLNCRCIEEVWGNGLALERHGEGLLTRSIVEINACTVMTEASLREAALQLRNEVRLAVLGSGSSTTNLDSFIRSLSIKVP